MIAINVSAEDAPRKRHHLVSAAPSLAVLVADARGAVPADGTAGVGTSSSSAFAAGTGAGPDDVAVDDLVTAAPLTGTVARFFTFDAVEVQT